MPASKNRTIPERVARRAFTACTPDANGCHISTYSVASHGYAQIGWHDEIGRTATTAHRAAWVHIHGQIPKDMTIDHLPDCDRRCVNVEHLRPMSNFENGRRNNRWHSDWPIGECAYGHPNSELKRYRDHTYCRVCNSEWHRTYRTKKKAQRNLAKSDLDAYLDFLQDCGICGLRVNKKLRYPHPRSPSIDHIQPLSLGGKHTLDNIQLAHLRCNNQKGGRR